MHVFSRTLRNKSMAVCPVYFLALVFLMSVAACAPPYAGTGTRAESASANELNTQDSLLLINHTDTAFAHLAFHPMTARPLPQQVEVSAGEITVPGDSIALWPCDSLDQYEDYTLHLYRVASPPDDAGMATGTLTRSITLTAARLEAARKENCRLVVSSL